MARLNNAAGFVKANMPLGQANMLRDGRRRRRGGLFHSPARPDFAAKARDWPNGDRPSDARY